MSACSGRLAAATKRAAGEGTQKLEPISQPQIKNRGQWNRLEIRGDDDRIVVSVNGDYVNEGTGARVKKGAICLRSEASAIEYRNIRIQPAE